MNSWSYGLKKDKHGFLRLCEIYSDNCYTTTPIEICGEDYQEIIDSLRAMIEDLEDPQIIDEECIFGTKD
jgi:hypothetical protein